MKIALFQTRIEWGNVSANTQMVDSWLKSMPREVDLVVLPEMFATGFGVDLGLANHESLIMDSVRQWCRTYGAAIAFTLMVKEDGCYYNRAFFVTPEGDAAKYDKRHLFRIGIEGKSFTSGGERVVVTYKDWNILLQICYDLRFPVFSRNKGNDYDLAIYMANWPVSRIGAWKTLLPARAVENQSYVCGVNVVGVDPNGLAHGGHSMVVDAKGRVVVELPELDSEMTVVDLSKEELLKFREKFPVWMDADQFEVM